MNCDVCGISSDARPYPEIKTLSVLGGRMHAFCQKCIIEFDKYMWANYGSDMDKLDVLKEQLVCAMMRCGRNECTFATLEHTQNTVSEQLKKFREVTEKWIVEHEKIENRP